jgi:hypothetical protein
MRPDSLLRLAVLVSALLFLLACPFKSHGAADSQATSDAPKPVLHNFASGDQKPWEKPVRIRLPKPHYMRPQRAPLFLNNSRPSTDWNHTLQ